MSEPIVYMDSSVVREGKLEQLKAAMNELVGFIQANEPRIVAYSVYLTEDGTRMNVFHVHHDPASLEYHMKVAGSEFPKFADLVRLTAIDIYGNPGDALLDRLRQKAELLGGGTVTVHELHAGFARFGGD